MKFQTQTEALVYALLLAINAPDGLEQEALEMCETIASDMTPEEVEACKAMVDEIQDLMKREGVQ